MHCPGCTVEMQEQRFEGNYGTTLALDICHACSALWFDDKESLQLTPGSVLRLFRIIHEKRGDRRNPLPESLGCPRCRARLASVIDMQRSTRFTYARCPRGHGRFITFFEFLREKNFIRPLDARQLKELRKQLSTINCSNCGAPVELSTGSACQFCRSPLSIWDVKQIEATVRELQKAEATRKEVDPLLAMKLLRDRQKVERIYGPGGMQAGGLGIGSQFGLVEAGLAAVVETLTDLL
jgi:Zn-finger nucleic acid-binding protein